MHIFLDIDGVMVPAKSWKSPVFLEDGFAEFSNNAVTTLQNLITPDVIIMLTTSHKANFSIAEWKNIFKHRGILIKKIKALPENINNFSRKDEIINWFKENNINDNFIIIDDDKSLNELPLLLKEKLILTNAHIGLIPEHLTEINKILNKFLLPA